MKSLRTLFTQSHPLALAVLFWLFLPTICHSAELTDIPLKNPSFKEGTNDKGFPVGWSLYSGNGPNQSIKVIDLGKGEQAALLEDGDPNSEIGLTQAVPVKPNETYEARVKVRGVEGSSANGAHLQLRFLPSNELFQVSFGGEDPDKFTEFSIRGTAPADTTTAVLYIYSHRDPTPKFQFTDVQLLSGFPPPPPPPPPPVPPQYTQLKNLDLVTEIVKAGKANLTIIVPAGGAYSQEASRLQQAITKITGCRVPIANDASPVGAVPITGNLLMLGNRSTNKTISELYNRYFCLTDLRYPGPEGYEVRSVHNPFGNGYNVILCGGSDATGVTAAVNALIAKLAQAGGKSGSLSVGWLMDIKLGKGITLPKDLRQFETWEASAMYGSSGYFGWNSISKRMAMYYMTGDLFQAREAIRLAFPDKQAFKEICEIDDERIENKDDPLAGPYHYNAHLMILFWDLIEESPVFTDEERLKVTNAFARQLNHRKDEGIYPLRQPPASVGSRHGQWAAISLYCLGRYFQNGYPNPVWAQCVRGAELHFAPLHEDANIYGEADNLYWYGTGTAPVLTYMVLSGDLKPLENGVLARLLRGQEVLVSGRQPDWALNGAALDFLHKAAYLTQDGRWLTYRSRAKVDTSIFRLGQSFWPEDRLQPKLPEDLVGKWTVNYLTKEQWRARQNGFPLEESFNNASFRSAPDASGDYVLLDGYNGMSRNPYHTFDVLELRLAGNTVLQGYLNQVLTKADGMVEPQVALDGALRFKEAIGGAAVAVGAVPKAAYSDWKRTLVQRVGKYALFVDDLTFRTDSDNVEVQIRWENSNSPMQYDSGKRAIVMQGFANASLPPGWLRFRSLDQKCTTNLTDPGATAKLDSLNITLLRANEIGAWMDMPFELKAKVTGDVSVDFLNYTDRGIVKILLDGKPVGEPYTNYATDVLPGKALLGKQELAAGSHRLRVEVAGKQTGVERCFIGLSSITIRPEGAPETAPHSIAEIQSSELLPTTPSGTTATQEWNGPVKKGQHRIFFSLVAMRPEQPGKSLQCVQLADNAAAFSLPQPGVASVGEYLGMKGDLVLLATDHLSGKGVTEAGLSKGILKSTSPVHVDWDFPSGVLEVVAPVAARLSLALPANQSLRLDGKTTKGEQSTDGLVTVALSPGRHRLDGATLAKALVQDLETQLLSRLAAGNDERAKLIAAAQSQPKPTAPASSPAMSASVGGAVVDLITIPAEGGSQICVAEGKTVHLFSADGKEIRQMPTDGPIRMLRWWPEHNLLLVGCSDEKVIAFDPAGNRKWVFVSEMDPAVFRAAKTYWFKSAPGHEGVQGLYTGVFLDGKSQCFVGGACTLEILDENGQLIKRMPQFWGTVHKFAIVPGPNGSLNLLTSRKITDGANVAIINNKTLDSTVRGFDGPPVGCTYIAGWMSQTRFHIFTDDLDGDGKQEVTSEITGAWNRITVWSTDGAAKYDASFGPGPPSPARNIRDLDIGDINGDGKKEILAVLSSGLVVALDNKCQKLWSKKLLSPPTVLKVFATSGNPRIVVGCEDGSVAVFDSGGNLVHLDKVTGKPTCIEALGNTVLMTTDKGDVRGFNVGQ